MYESRAAYRPKPVRRRGLTLTLWLQWMVASTVGAVLGHVLAQTLSHALIPDFNEPNIYTVIVGIFAGAIMGASIGAFQGAVLAQRIGLEGWRDWILASIVGGAIRWAILSPILSLLLTVRTGWKGAASSTDLCVFFFAIILFGALTGIAFGIPQSIVLRKHLGQATDLDGPAWSLANAAGGLMNIPVVSLSGLNPAAITALLGVAGGELTDKVLIVIAITWAFTALATTLPLGDRLRVLAKG